MFLIIQVGVIYTLQSFQAKHFKCTISLLGEESSAKRETQCFSAKFKQNSLEWNMKQKYKIWEQEGFSFIAEVGIFCNIGF